MTGFTRTISLVFPLFCITAFIGCQKTEQPTKPIEPLPVVESNVVWLGFPLIDRTEWPPEIKLVEDQSLGSAFLLQLRRQAVLLAARDEIGATTRDAFLDETASNDAVRIPNVAEFTNADPKYVGHRQFLAELEELSRNEFVTELQKRGVLSNPQSATEALSEEGDDSIGDSIDELLGTWTLVSQFEAARRTHEVIRLHGESLPLLKQLVRSYTQLQMLTNVAPRDSHRVFQARAMLYAQRAVAKYGETPETLALRAAAWSLNNFHRLAREEFAVIPPDELENADVWTRLAKAYCEFDFKAIDAMFETVDAKTERPFAKLLYFFLLDYSYNLRTLARPFGEKAIADLPDCARLYTRTLNFNSFDMVRAPDGSPFHEHLARHVAPDIRKMYALPEEVLNAANKLDSTVKKPSGGILSGLFGGGASGQDFPLEQYFIDLAALLQSLSESKNDSSEPSLTMLATLLGDNEYQSILQLALHLRGRNGYPETYIMPAMPVLDEHPAVEYLALLCRDNSHSSSYSRRLAQKTIPYNLLSLNLSGYSTDVFNSHSGRRYYSPYFFNHLYADRENVRDMVHYHNKARAEIPDGEYVFTVDLLHTLCPKNPYTVGLRLSRGNDVSMEEAETLSKEFADFPRMGESLADYYLKHNLPDKVFEIIKDDYKSKLTSPLHERLYNLYLERNEHEKAIDIIKKFLETPQARESLNTPHQLGTIGLIVLQQGKIEEAEQYFVPGVQTNASWGLSRMAFYQEIIGNFDAAERLLLADRSSYPQIGPFGLWAFRYRTNRPDVQESMDEILERFTLHEAAIQVVDRTTRQDNRIEGYQVIYPCFCMDIPYPDQLGKDPLMEEFLRSGIGMIGFLAWFEAKEKGDDERAAKLLRLLRELWVLDDKTDPFLAAQRAVIPTSQGRAGVAIAYQTLAALFELDQRKEKPGQLNQEEIDHLLRSHFRHDLSPELAPWLLYLVGRYYDLCGEKNKAVDCYRRVLGFRASYNNYLRCFAVKELRKSGLPDEEYIEWSQSDPRTPRQTISRLAADIMCRQHFRVYTESPSATVLERSAATERATATDFGATTTRNPGWYKVTKVLFCGEAVPEDEMVVYWRIPEDSSGEWLSNGISDVTRLLTHELPQRSDGVYPLRLGRREPVSAEASFHGDNLALTVWLKPDAEPMRIEMQKVADIP